MKKANRSESGEIEKCLFYNNLVKYYLSPFPGKCQQTVRDDVAKFWNEVVPIVNKGKTGGSKKQAVTITVISSLKNDFTICNLQNKDHPRYEKQSEYAELPSLQY